MAEMTVSLQGDYPIKVEMDGVSVEMDAPPTLGGTAALPNPTDWFLASVVACKVAFAVGFIKRRELDVKGIKATAEVVKGATKLDEINVSLAIDGEIPEKMRGALEKSIAACYVGQTVKEGCEIKFDVSY